MIFRNFRNFGNFLICFRKFNWKSDTRHSFLEIVAKSGQIFIKISQKRFSFLCSIHRGRPRQLYRVRGFVPVLRPQSANIRNEPRGLRLPRPFFYFQTSLALSRNFLKFPIYLCPSHAWTLALRARSRFHIRWRGVRFFAAACPPSFSVFPFRPGILGLFGAPLQPPAPKKKKFKNFRKINFNIF